MYINIYLLDDKLFKVDVDIEDISDNLNDISLDNIKYLVVDIKKVYREDFNLIINKIYLKECKAN